MTRGPQFENTYYFDHNGGTRGTGASAKEEQGLLFHPATGTGTYADPSVPDYGRHVRMALGFGHDVINDVTSIPAHHLAETRLDGEKVADFGAAEGIGSFSPSTRQIHVSSDSYNQGRTLTHEIGHALDRHIYQPLNHRESYGRGADPVEEGLADGYAERHFSMAHHPDRRLSHDHADRELDMKTDGYSTEHPVWSMGAAPHTSRALYAASRQWVATSPNGYKDVPSRQSLVSATAKPGRTVAGSDQYRGDELLLGHMHAHSPEVRGVLERLGLGNQGKSAENRYREKLGHIAPERTEPVVDTNQMPLFRKSDHWDKSKGYSTDGYTTYSHMEAMSDESAKK